MEKKKSLPVVVEIEREIKKELGDKDTLNALLENTFKEIKNPALVKQALMAGMLRGFKFKDFLEKNVYALQYGNTFSLVTGIDYSRKVAMRSGLAGKSAPTYKVDEMVDDLTCSITVKRNVGGVIGEYTATVYFKEYYAGNKNPDGSVKTNSYGAMKPNLWDTKPRTMIAKVAEMHALRSAFPEEMAQHYVEEEMVRENVIVLDEENELDITYATEQLTAATNTEELVKAWASITADERADERVIKLKDELKTKYASTPSGTENGSVAPTKKGKGNGNGTKKGSGDEDHKG